MKGLVKGIPKSFQSNLVGSITNFSIDTGVKGREIPFVFSPTSLSDTVTANFSQTSIPGASAPQVTYANTGARTVSFTIDLPLDYLPPSSLYSDFEDYLNAFRALVYPKYSAAGDKVESPHCKLVTSNIEIDGVCTSCAIDYRTDRYANDGSMAASISLSFMEVLDNVKDVDAKWIANSKVKVLGTTTMTTQTSNSDSFIESSVSNIVEDGKCTVTLLGDTDVTITAPSGSLLDAINNGLWSDPGCVYTQHDKYNVKKLYGYVKNADSVSISNIHQDTTNLWYCTANGVNTYIHTSPFHVYGSTGDTIVYWEIYLPYYDGNKYEIGSARWRYIRIKVVNS